MTISKSGINDLPIIDAKGDKFSISGYIEALSDFIKTCETPITISLQGGWGTGKTSFMSLINQKLEPVKILGESKEIIEPDKSSRKNKNPVVTVSFNTWQYTQFNMEDTLGQSFLNYIINVLSDEFDDKSNTKTLAKNAMKMLYYIGANTVLKHANTSITDIEKAISSGEIVLDHAKQIETLKDSLRSLVEKHLENIKNIYGENSNPRLVIFIDDLDRLNPKIAVGLLEVIKLFVDIEGCVFVLAVDNQVIEDGIKDSKGISNSKTKSFLDKIIQVPFKIPVESYNYTQFLEENISFLKEDEDSKTKSTVVKLLRNSIGSNPRSLKRLINNYHLNYKVYQNISNSKEELGYRKKAILLSIMCMQLVHQPLYAMLLNINDDDRFNILNLNSITSNHRENSSEGKSLDTSSNVYEKSIQNRMKELESLQIYHGDYEENLESYIVFLNLLNELLRGLSKNNKEINDNEMDEFDNLLFQSEITTSGEDRKWKTTYSENIEEIFIEEYLKNSKRYKIERNGANAKINGEVLDNMGAKESFKMILEKLITTQKQVDKLNNLEQMKKATIRQVYFPLLEKKSTEYITLNEKYGTIKLDTLAGEPVILGHKFSFKDSLYYMQKLIEYIEPEIEWEVTLTVREALTHTS